MIATALATGTTKISGGLEKSDFSVGQQKLKFNKIVQRALNVLDPLAQLWINGYIHL